MNLLIKVLTGCCLLAFSVLIAGVFVMWLTAPEHLSDWQAQDFLLRSQINLAGMVTLISGIALALLNARYGEQS